MKIIKVAIAAGGCATAAEPIPENAVMSVMTATEVTVYEECDDLPTEYKPPVINE